VNCELISIGDEILVGQIVNTNASTMSKMLNSIGCWVSRIIVVGDKPKEIEDAINESLNRVSIVLTTGGLGPTNDDITRTILCKIFDSSLRFDNSTYEHIEQIFTKRGTNVNKLNKDQAMVPEKAIILDNALGTAPGFLFKTNGKILIAMPGVPFEMEHLMQTHVLKIIKVQFTLPEIHHRTLIVQGTYESLLAEKLGDYEINLPADIKLAYLPSPGLIRLRLTYRPPLGLSSTDLIDHAFSNLKSILRDNMVSDIDEPVSAAIGRILTASGKTLGTAESCTGGYISSQITMQPGASHYFKGSIIAYDNTIKTSILGVPEDLLKSYGAVSTQVVEAMATGALSIINCDYAIATSGIAGPDGGTIDKPVGTVCIAIASKSKVISQQTVFTSRRDVNIQRATNAAFYMLFNELRNQ